MAHEQNFTQPPSVPLDPTAATLADAKQRAQRAERELDDVRRIIARLENAQQQTSGARERASGDPVSIAPQPSGSHEDQSRPSPSDDPETQLRREPMMAHLFDALAEGKDIGHYGRLVFAMIARHFLGEEELIAWLRKDPAFEEAAASALLRQVQGRDYNPPKRERILEWQAQQDFPILPNPDDPDCGNVYRNLKFPEKVYEHIEQYQEEKAAASN